MKLNLLPIAVFLLISTLTLSKLSIRQPIELAEWWNKNPEKTHISLASFGYNPWGRAVFGNFVLADPINACTFLNRTEEQYREHPIIIAKRGDCTFVVKAHYAQIAGAKMLIIVDNVYEEVDNRLMIDDGNLGQTVNIPVGLLSRDGGSKIIDSLKSPDENINQIEGAYTFEIAKSDQVSYTIWLSSSSERSYQFVNEWRNSYLDRLSGNTKMDIHYAHMVGDTYGNRDDPNCLCNGKYCAPDPDGGKSNSGRSVLLEDLKEMCIFRSVAPEAWWTYMKHFDTFCIAQGGLEGCSKKAMEAAHINADKVDLCVKNSFDTKNKDTCTSNKILDAEEELMKKENVYIFPDVSIGNFTFRGNLIPVEGVFEAVCESFTTMPLTCDKYFMLGDVSVPTVSYLWLVSASAGFLFLFGLLVFGLYKKYLAKTLRKDMQRDVNIAVSQYIALTDTGEKEGNRLVSVEK